MTELAAPGDDVKITPSDARKFYYCLHMRGYKPGEGSVAEKNTCEKLAPLLQSKFKDGDKYVVIVVGESEKGDPPVFIKVGACLADLEKYAEEQKIEVRVKNKYSQERGVLVETFTVARKAAGVFQAPNVTLSGEELIDEGSPDDDVLLPYQKDEIIRNVIMECIDTFMGIPFKNKGLRVALKKGVIKAIFPLHLPAEEREYIYQNYLSPKVMLAAPWIFTKRNHRYVEYWRSYFGEKIGMYVGFLSFYTTALLAVALPGFILALYQYSRGADNAGVPFYCLLVALWSVVWLQYWARKQSVFAFRWNMSEYEDEEKELETRVKSEEEAEYGFYNKGDWVDLDAYVQSRLIKEPAKGVPEEASIKQIVPKNNKRQENFVIQLLKAICTNSLLLTMVVGVVFATLGLLFFRLVIQGVISDFWGGVAGGVANGVVIAILDQLYNRVAVALNDWQHHRTATEYEDSLIFKTFFFQFVNAYCSLFYIAFYKGNQLKLFGRVDYCKNPDGTRASDCMTELSTQLQSVLLTRIFIGNLTELGIPWITYRYNLYKSRGGSIVQKAKTADPLQREAEKPVYSTEKVSGTFYDYAELAIQFGYVVLFAPAFPLAPALALVSNIVECSTDGFKLLNRIKKPFYQGAAEIGPWFSVFNFLCIVAVGTNSLIIGFTSHQLDVWLDNPSTGTKFLVIVVIEHCVLGLLWLIAAGVPDKPSWIREKEAHIDKIQYLEGEYQQVLTEWKQSLEEEKKRGSHVTTGTLTAKEEREKYGYDASEDEIVAKHATEETGQGSSDGASSERVY